MSHTRFDILGKGKVRVIKGTDTLLGGANYEAILRQVAKHPFTERHIMQEFKRTTEKELKRLVKAHVEKSS